METIKEKIAKLEKAIASPATPENIKMSMENALDDLKDKLAEEMSPTFTYYKGEQIMYEPTKNEYFVVGNDENIFNSLEDAKKFIDNPKGAINTEYAKMAAAETKEFTFLKNNPKGQARALTSLSKKFMRGGKVMTGYEIIESLPKGLEIKVIKLHSKKSEKGFTEKTVIGDFIADSKAEVDYYNYLSEGGYPYSGLLKDNEKQKEIEKEKRIKELQEQEARDREVMVNEHKRKLDHIKYILEGGETTIGAKQLELLKRIYHLENGELVKSNDWKVGDEVYVISDKDSTKEILTKIVGIKDGSGYMDSEPRYVVEKKDEIYNAYKTYEQLFPATKEEVKELQKGIEVEQEHKDTLEGVAAGEITVLQAIEETAKTHIEENPKYYDELEKIEVGDISNVQQEMQVQFDLIKAEIDKQKLKNKSVISVAKMRIEKMLKENPSAYPFYVEKYLDLPKSVRDRINPFDIWYSGEKRPVMEWLKEQNKNVFDVVKVEEYSSPKTKVIQTKPDDKNFMDIHADFVGDDNLRPVMLGTHFEENAIVSTNAHIMLITPYRGDAEKLDGNFCHTKKCIEENKEGYRGNKPVSDGRFPAWKQVVPFSNTEYNMNTAAVYDFIRNANKYELMNKITNTLVFKYGEEKIGFNANLMLTCIQGMSELGHKELSITIGTSNRAALIIPKGRAEDVRNIKTDFTLLMPVMLGGNDKWGNNDSPSEEIGMTYFGEFNLETSCYTDPNELTYCFDVEKVKVKKAEKKVKELEKKIEELTSAIEPMIKEKELPSAEKHGMFKVVNGIFEGTEFFGRIDGDRVINEDSIGQSFPIANVKRIGYELGQGYSSDFDFEGLLRTALRANTSWGIEALKKLHYSFEDNNYHTLGRPLWEAVKSLQLGAEPSAKLHLHEFQEAVQQELEDYLAPEVDESNIDPNTLQPIAKEEGSVEPIDAVEAITDAIEDNEKTSWEELKELAETMIQVSKGKEKKEWVETKELAEVMLAD